MKIAKKRTTPIYGGRTVSGINSIPPPPPREPLDSTPTPVIELGWKDIHAKFLLLASRFNSRAFELKKNYEILDIKASKECENLAENIKRICDRIENWDNLSNEALAAEKSWVAEQYINYMTLAYELIGCKRI